MENLGKEIQKCAGTEGWKKNDDRIEKWADRRAEERRGENRK